MYVQAGREASAQYTAPGVTMCSLKATEQVDVTLVRCTSIARFVEARQILCNSKCNHHDGFQ